MNNVMKGWGLESEHRSMPQWTTFWSWKEWPDDTRFIIIVRRPDISVRSAYAAHHGDPHFKAFRHLIDHRMDEKELDGWWWHAMEVLADFPRAWWMSYEALVKNPERQLLNLVDWLGIEKPSQIPVIFDGNEKWR